MRGRRVNSVDPDRKSFLKLLSGFRESACGPPALWSCLPRAPGEARDRSDMAVDWSGSFSG